MIKMINVFSTVPLPKYIVAPFYERQDRIEFKMSEKVNIDRKDVLLEIKGCDAVIVSHRVTADKEFLDAAGENLKVKKKSIYFYSSRG